MALDGRKSIPNGLTTAERSKMIYGMLAFSSKAPRNRPPRPAPTIRTVGLSSVDMVGGMRGRLMVDCAIG